MSPSPGAAAIGSEHLLAAAALWEYAERSVECLFGGRSGDGLAEKVAAALGAAGALTRTQIRDLTGRRARSEEITRALEALAQQGKIAKEMRHAPGQDGRPQEVWHWVAQVEVSAQFGRG